MVKSRIEEVKAKLQQITTMIHDLSKKTDSTEIIGDIIENELANMDKAIEEAASNIQVNYYSYFFQYFLNKSKFKRNKTKKAAKGERWCLNLQFINI